MSRKLPNAFLGFASLAIAASVGVAAQKPATPKAAQVHIDRALALAGKSYMRTTASLQCGLSGPAMANFQNTVVPEPRKLFDNFYYVGIKSVGAYALATKDGIVLIDALDNSDEAQNVIERDLRSFGLDPAQIKYVIVTHGHGDHYGGARYFAEKYGAHVMLSQADWDMVSRPPMRPAGAPSRPFAPPPQKDLIATDGMVLDIGGQQIRIVLTPGHTPGTISLILPVTDRGQRHVLAMWGGTGVPRDAAARAQYIASAAKFDTASKAAGADIELSNHPFVDDSLARMDAFHAAPKGPNPFVIGRAAYARYSAIIAECAKAVAAGGPSAS